MLSRLQLYGASDGVDIMRRCNERGSVQSTRECGVIVNNLRSAVTRQPHESARYLYSLHIQTFIYRIIFPR